MEYLQHIWDFLYNFFFIGVIGYIIKRWLAGIVVTRVKSWIAANERNMAIWIHYQHRARNQGHNDESVLDCDDGRCNVFKTYAS